MNAEQIERDAVEIRCLRCNVEGVVTAQNEYICVDCGNVLARAAGEAPAELHSYAGP